MHAKVARPFVLLDRDGTIIVEKHYLGDPDQVTLLPGAAEAVAALRDAGYGVVVVTNQSGIGRGMFGEQDMHACNGRMRQLLLEQHATACIDAIYHCPHAPDARCACRKPEPGMGLRAAAEWDIALDKSFVIGDKCVDVCLGDKLGCRSVLVRSGHGRREVASSGCKPWQIADDLREAAHLILAETKIDTP